MRPLWPFVAILLTLSGCSFIPSFDGQVFSAGAPSAGPVLLRIEKVVDRPAVSLAPLIYRRTVVALDSTTPVGRYEWGLLCNGPYRDVTWGQLQVSRTEVAEAVFATLSRQGHAMQGDPDELFPDRPDSVQLQLGGRITAVDVSLCRSRNWLTAEPEGVTGKARIRVDWVLHDTLLRQDLLSRTTEGQVDIDDGTGAGADSVVLAALAEAVLALDHEPGFRAALTPTTAAATTAAAAANGEWTRPVSSVPGEPPSISRQEPVPARVDQPLSEPLSEPPIEIDLTANDNEPGAGNGLLTLRTSRGRQTGLVLTHGGLALTTDPGPAATLSVTLDDGTEVEASRLRGNGRFALIQLAPDRYAVCRPRHGSPAISSPVRLADGSVDKSGGSITGIVAARQGTMLQVDLSGSVTRPSPLLDSDGRVLGWVEPTPAPAALVTVQPLRSVLAGLGTRLTGRRGAGAPADPVEDPSVP
jgi:hypothetical protein